MASAIQIVLQDSADSPNMAFVEIENELGNSISIGQAYRREDGYWIILISALDINDA